jgi:hypothetical protein
LVAENVTWFQQLGTQPLDIHLNIVDFPKTVLKPEYDFNNADRELTWYVENEESLNVCALLSKMTFDIGAGEEGNQIGQS